MNSFSSPARYGADPCSLIGGALPSKINHGAGVRVPTFLTTTKDSIEELDGKLGREVDWDVAEVEDFPAIVEAKGKSIAGIVLDAFSPELTTFIHTLREYGPTVPWIPVAYVLGTEIDEQLPAGCRRFQGWAENLAIARYLLSDTRPSVLVVEDDPGIRELLTKMLSRHYRIDVAREGNEAIELLQKQRFDLVLLDHMLPTSGPNGAELLTLIRDDLSDTPVIMITAYHSDRKRIELLVGGAHEYIQKPFRDINQVRSALARVLIEHHSVDSHHYATHAAENGKWERAKSRFLSYEG